MGGSLGSEMAFLSKWADFMIWTMQPRKCWPGNLPAREKGIMTCANKTPNPAVELAGWAEHPPPPPPPTALSGPQNSHPQNSKGRKELVLNEMVQEQPWPGTKLIPRDRIWCSHRQTRPPPLRLSSWEARVPLRMELNLCLQTEVSLRSGAPSPKVPKPNWHPLDIPHAHLGGGMFSFLFCI